MSHVHEAITPSNSLGTVRTRCGAIVYARHTSTDAAKQTCWICFTEKARLDALAAERAKEPA